MESKIFTHMWFLQADQNLRENPKRDEFIKRIKKLALEVNNFNEKEQFFEEARKIAEDCQILHYSTLFHYPTHKMLQDAWRVK